MSGRATLDRKVPIMPSACAMSDRGIPNCGTIRLPHLPASD